MSSREALPPILIAVAFAVATAGAVIAVGADAPVADGPDPEPDDVIERMVDGANEHGDVHGTFTVRYVVDGERHERRSEMWDRAGTDHHRYAIHETTDDRFPAGRFIVSDGETLYTYDPDDEAATRYDLAEGNVTFPQTEYTHYGAMTESFELEYVGRETVAGREAHHVRFTLPDASPDGINVVLGETEYAFPVGSAVDDEYVFEEHSVYVDVEHAYPLAERTVLSTEEAERTTFSRTLETVRFDATFDDGRFTFDPPAGTEITDHEFGDRRSFDSIRAASGTVPFDVPAASAPDHLAVEEVTVRHRDDNATVRIEYAAGTAASDSRHDTSDSGTDVNSDTTPGDDPGTPDDGGTTSDDVGTDDDPGTAGGDSETDDGDAGTDDGSVPNDDDTVTVTVSEERVEPSGITRRVGDREATVSNTLSGIAIHWECDGLRYTVSGTAGQGALFEVAESVESTACADGS